MNLPSLLQLAQYCKDSPIGKHLPDAIYVHVSAISCLHLTIQNIEQQARQFLPPQTRFNLIKFNYKNPKISYLDYPNFEENPHPALVASTQVNWQTGDLTYFYYGDRPNPPILHRKETFLAPDHPQYAQFAHLTQQEEVLGLLKNSRNIGTSQYWENHLQQQKIEIHNHTLACPLFVTSKILTPTIKRHRAAIKRNTLSKPVRLAIEAGLFSEESTFFDYGCGYGTDVKFVSDRGIASSGFDPYYQPQNPHKNADVVNLGYIINVIEDAQERRQALLNAWALARQVLIVAAQVLIHDDIQGLIAYEDGIITSRNTFQKYYEQDELKTYIDQVLEVDAIPVALGIYFVFRDESQAEAFRASRFRSRATTPRIRLTVKRFEDYQPLLQPVMNFITERGRLPFPEELESQHWSSLEAEFKTIKRAFQVILQATDASEWDAITQTRRQDLMVYLALTHFGKRPKLRDLSSMIQKDIKFLFGSYQSACTAADLMLMTLGNLALIQERCHQSKIGQKRPHSLWVHISALSNLDPVLRLLEGCASRTIGRPEEATIIKFHTQKPKITYLFYPHFDTEPHPCLRTSVEIDLRDLQVKYRDYDPRFNPPILHQKEQLILPDYPNYAKFAKLSDQERQWGLLDELSRIQTADAWQRYLKEHCAELKGHRLVWRKDADPYQMKLLKAKMRHRKNQFS
ncbi:DNA phosphorothioation-associated putative methyltransferase [Spirulina sp. CCNP1310]|uniref:DNA phosphorothioation-associated putative methyltransferase n=1 Tax=Spirulina sp. CCNP1310 TaxID=3110249 RepID=UPI002B1F7D05|nr:DNA phosphorothioation-associated putative methyltransferase [Spirulina sp. CCNP1310]MEA5417740.1 DNA phosphorothioation-associated putative methyltransferase [Spirulina sp. CCNP1310]